MVRKFAAAAAVSLLALAAACGGPSGETTETATSTPAAAPAPAPAEAPAAEAEPAAPVELVSLEITNAAGETLSGDPARGQRVFSQCMACHSVNAGENRVGPSLHAIIGRTAGSVEGFRYSEANRTSGKTWTEQALYDYLESPQTVIRGTTMTFAGIRDGQQRADLIAYLKTHTQ